MHGLSAQVWEVQAINPTLGSSYPLMVGGCFDCSVCCYDRSRWSRRTMHDLQMPGCVRDDDACQSGDAHVVAMAS